MAPLGGTPFAMKLEATTPVVATKDEVEVSDDTPSDEVEVEAAVEEVEEELHAAPTSDDPAEWEAFLAAEGLGIEDEDEDDFEI